MPTKLTVVFAGVAGVVVQLLTHHSAPVRRQLPLVPPEPQCVPPCIRTDAVAHRLKLGRAGLGAGVVGGELPWEERAAVV